MKDTEIIRLSEFEDKYWWHTGRQKIITKVIEGWIKFDKKANFKILDVGSGTGGTTLILKKYGTVYATDFSIEGLKHCQQHGLCDVINSTILDLPFRPECFDIITIFDALEHIDKDVEALRQVGCLLKKEGIIVITVPAFQFLWSNHDEAVSHVRRYNYNNLLSVIKLAGLQKIRLTYFIFAVFPLVAIYRLISRLKSSNPNTNTNTVPKSDLIPLPDIVNRVLQNILFAESKLIRMTNFPFGLSLICIAKK